MRRAATLPKRTLRGPEEVVPEVVLVVLEVVLVVLEVVLVVLVVVLMSRCPFKRLQSAGQQGSFEKVMDKKPPTPRSEKVDPGKAWL